MDSIKETSESLFSGRLCELWDFALGQAKLYPGQLPTVGIDPEALVRGTMPADVLARFFGDLAAAFNEISDDPNLELAATVCRILANYYRAINGSVGQLQDAVFDLGQLYVTLQSIPEINKQVETSSKNSKKGVKSGETRKNKAAKRWGNAGLKIAKLHREKTPDISQAKLANMINSDLGDKAPDVPQIVLSIRKWEREGSLKKATR